MREYFQSRRGIASIAGFLALFIVGAALIFMQSGANLADSTVTVTQSNVAATRVPVSVPSMSTPVAVADLVIPTVPAPSSEPANGREATPGSSPTPVPVSTPVLRDDQAGAEYAPWVYSWTSQHPIDWPREWRWQPALPRPQPGAAWDHETFRLPPLATLDEPFILIRGQRTHDITGDQMQAMIDLTRRHHEMRHAFFIALDTADFTPLDGIFRDTLAHDTRTTLDEMRAEDVTLTNTPLVNEIGAVVYSGLWGFLDDRVMDYPVRRAWPYLIE